MYLCFRAKILTNKRSNKKSAENSKKNHYLTKVDGSLFPLFIPDSAECLRGDSKKIGNILQ